MKFQKKGFAMLNSHQSDSDLNKLQEMNPAKIRHAIRMGLINPSLKDNKGQDLLTRTILSEISPEKIRALLSGSKSIDRMPDLFQALQILDQESKRVLCICENNLSRPKMSKEDKKLISQLLYLAAMHTENTIELKCKYPHLPVILVRAEEQKITSARTGCSKNLGNHRCACQVTKAFNNTAWSLE